VSKQDKYKEQAENFKVSEGGMNLNRGCNDVLCFLVFVSFVGSMGYLTYYGYHNGNVAKLVAPLDADNNFCG
jgi:hypothetical protein